MKTQRYLIILALITSSILATEPAIVHPDKAAEKQVVNSHDKTDAGQEAVVVDQSSKPEQETEAGSPTEKTPEKQAEPASKKILSKPLLIGGIAAAIAAIIGAIFYFRQRKARVGSGQGKTRAEKQAPGFSPSPPVHPKPQELDHNLIAQQKIRSQLRIEQLDECIAEFEAVVKRNPAAHAQNAKVVNDLAKNAYKAFEQAAALDKIRLSILVKFIDLNETDKIVCINEEYAFNTLLDLNRAAAEDLDIAKKAKKSRIYAETIDNQDWFIKLLKSNKEYADISKINAIKSMNEDAAELKKAEEKVAKHHANLTRLKNVLEDHKKRLKEQLDVLNTDTKDFEEAFEKFKKTSEEVTNHGVDTKTFPKIGTFTQAFTMTMKDFCQQAFQDTELAARALNEADKSNAESIAAQKKLYQTTIDHEAANIEYYRAIANQSENTRNVAACNCQEKQNSVIEAGQAAHDASKKAETANNQVKQIKTEHILGYYSARTGNPYDAIVQKACEIMESTQKAVADTKPATGQAP